MFALSFHIANLTFPVGDQGWFKVYAQQIHFQYLQFGMERYFTWSSRLLIEPLTMFSSVHEQVFPFIVFIATALLLSTSKKLSENVPIVPGLLLFVFFPLTIFRSAGISPTYINYLFPASLFIFSIYHRNSSNLFTRLISLLAFMLAVMQEQFAVYAFLWLGFELCKEFAFYKTSKITILYILISLIGIASAKFAPGNIARTAIETTNWFPNFKDFNIFQKISLGVLETGQYLLTLSKSFGFIVLFFGVLALVGILKKRYVSVGIVSIIGLLMMLTSLKISTPLTFLFSVSITVRDSKDIVLNSTTVGAVVGYFIIFAFLLVALSMVLDKKNRSWFIYLFYIGLACRMLISFSPTIYASSTRTMIPFILSLYIITCKLVNDVWVIYRQRK